MKRLMDLNGTNENWDIDKEKHVEDACSLTSSRKNVRKGSATLSNFIFLHHTSIYLGTPFVIILWCAAGSGLYWMDGQIWPKPPQELTNCDPGFYKDCEAFQGGMLGTKLA